MDNLFVHYGHQSFDRNLFQEIRNIAFVKPEGGLWASRINAKYGWKQWCKDEEFRDCNPNNCFVFKLKSTTKILVINNAEELKKLPRNQNVPSYFNDTHVCLDFEELSKNYDAIEVNISEDKQLYWDLYGWDCDSILIFNQDAVEEI